MSSEESIPDYLKKVDAEVIAKHILERINRNSLLHSVLGSSDSTDNGDGPYTHTWNPIASAGMFPPTLDEAIRDLVKRELTKQLPKVPEVQHYPGAMVGYRCFRIYGEAVESVSYHHRWNVHGVNHAECSHHGHRAPRKGCGCGMWAYKSLGALREYGGNMYAGQHSCTAIVAAWGRVIPHDFGVRAEKMKILAILKQDKWGAHEGHRVTNLPMVPISAIPTIIEAHDLTSLPVIQPPEPQSLGWGTGPLSYQVTWSYG